MSKRSGKKNVRATRNSASHSSGGSARKKAPMRRQSDSPLDELNARAKAKRRRVGNAPAEQRRKTQTRSRRHAVRAEDGGDDVDMDTEEENNGEEEDDDENTAEEDADGPFEQTASEQEEEEYDDMWRGRNDEDEDPDAARDVDGGDDEVQDTSTKLSPRDGLSRKSSPSPSSPNAPLRQSSRVSSTVSDNGSTTSGNGTSTATRREARNGPSPHASSFKVSSTSAQNLFQFTCRLLQSQKLEFEVRAREFEEKNARLVGERYKWEKKIRGVKRQLQSYGHPVDGVDGGGLTSNENGAENGAVLATNALDPHFRGSTNWSVTAATTALTTTGIMNGGNGGDMASSNSTQLITMRDAISRRTSAAASSSTSSGMDSLIPVSIHHMEAQIQDTLRLRRQQVDELMKDFHGFHGLNDKITRLR